MVGDSFYLPPPAGLPPLVPILDTFSDGRVTTLPFMDEDAAAFIAEVAPTLQETYSFAVTPEVEHRLHRAPLAVAVWLDKYDSGITAKVLFRYGETELSPFDLAAGASSDRILLRDRNGETNFLDRLGQAGFTAQDGRYIMLDEAKVYQFLREVLPELTEQAEVYYSEAFNRLRFVRPPRFSGVVRMDENSDLLEVSFEAENLPETDLLDLLAALREKRKYYRLKTGAFIPLDEPELVAAGRLLDQLGFTGSDLRKQLISLPKHRALYLEGAIRDYGRERFHLNEAFKKLVFYVTGTVTIYCTTVPAGFTYKVKELLFRSPKLLPGRLQGKSLAKR